MIATVEQRVTALAEAEQRLVALERECARSQRLPADGSAGGYACAEELAQAASRCREFERELAKTKCECEGAERMLQSLLDQLAGETGSSAHGIADLEGRCVLYIGGRTGMIRHCRALVEHCRGRFIHHDGGLEDSFKRLHTLLASADAVVCAAGNINHGAYHIVRRFCKRHGKPCVLLRNPSLSTFANGIPALSPAVLSGRARAAPFSSPNHERRFTTCSPRCLTKPAPRVFGLTRKPSLQARR